MGQSPSVSSELEQALRDITGVPGLAIASGPTRLTGGFDTDTYAFSLSDAPGGLSGDLILRQFRRPEETGRVVYESALQNTAAAAGHPVPDVPVDSVGATIDGRPFIVMRRAPGKPLLDVLSEDPMGALEPSARLMGRTQARLHALDPSPVMKTLSSSGLDPDDFSPFKLLDDIERLDAATSEPAINALAAWLSGNRPGPPERLSICHGDFHPANLIVEGLELTGVIDWGNYSFGHPEYDVAVTRMVVTIGPLEDSPVPVDQLKQMLEMFVRAYNQAYAEHREVDEDLVGYYTVLRAGRAMSKVIAARHGRDIRGVAHDGYAWERPVIYDHIRDLIRERTGIDGGPLDA